jgi:hypothetical protein
VAVIVVLSVLPLAVELLRSRRQPDETRSPD